MKDYNVKLNGVYTVLCRNCGEKTKVQNADGIGLCGNCDYEWEFDESLIVGYCEKCDISVTVGNWILHNTKTDDERNHPISLDIEHWEENR